MFHHPKDIIANCLGVIRYLADVLANEAEHGLGGIKAPYPGHALNGILVSDITTNAVNGIRWINDYSSIFQNINHLLDKTALRVVGVNGNKHTRFVLILMVVGALNIGLMLRDDDFVALKIMHSEC